MANLCFETVPEILKNIGKVRNPYPNVDAYSGALLHHYGKFLLILGMHEMDFYTVTFAVSRALGILSNGIWARAYGLPIERPNSINCSFLEKIKVQ